MEDGKKHHRQDRRKESAGCGDGDGVMCAEWVSTEEERMRMRETASY